jgi:hypothetical protein
MGLFLLSNVTPDASLQVLTFSTRSTTTLQTSTAPVLFFDTYRLDNKSSDRFNGASCICLGVLGLGVPKSFSLIRTASLDSGYDVDPLICSASCISFSNYTFFGTS